MGQCSNVSSSNPFHFRMSPSLPSLLVRISPTPCFTYGLTTNVSPLFLFECPPRFSGLGSNVPSHPPFHVWIAPSSTFYVWISPVSCFNIPSSPVSCSIVSRTKSKGFFSKIDASRPRSPGSVGTRKHPVSLDCTASNINSNHYQVINVL